MLSADDGYCTQRALIVTESYKSNLDKEYILQRAFAFSDILKQIDIYIRDGELLFGNLSSKLGLRPLFPEFKIGITEHSKTGSVGEKIAVNEYTEIMAIYEFWRGKDSFSKIDDLRDSSTRWMQEELIINSAAEVNGHGHIIVDYEKILKYGISGLKSLVQDELQKGHSLKQKLFYESMLITLDSASSFALRYHHLLAELADNENEENRREELYKMSIIAENIAEKPPETFWEAVQLVSLVYLLLHQEHNGYSISLGRLDKILYPFYKKDMEANIISYEQAFELLENFCIKVMELPIGGIKDTKTCAITIGGLNYDGNYVCNDISYMFLKTVKTLRLNSPAVIVRWHSNMPDDFKNKIIKTLKYGTGYPGLFGDKAVIKSLVQEHGATLEEAHEWAEVGCAEVYVAGKSRPVDAGLVNLPIALLLAANEGNSLLSGRNIGITTKDADELKTIEDLLSEYEKVFNFLIEKEIQLDRHIKFIQKEMRPTPFTSALMSSCIENGKDLLDNGEKFNLSCVGIFSMANLIDSLVAVDELVFKRKLLSIKEYIIALRNDFEGYENIKEAIDELPKYGNNDINADRFIPIVNDINYKARKMIMWKYNVDISYEAIPREVHIDLGLVSPSTFDGRKKGEPFADGISCSQGKDTEGLTSLMQTVIKTDQPKHITNGIVFNLKFHPRIFDNQESCKKIKYAFDTYFDNEGEQVQVICTDPRELIEAQNHPEKYSNLIVRVAGFSAYFTTLRKELQDEIISRTLYE